MTYLRLDYVFCTPIILANTRDASKYPCSWSDHHITTLSTQFIGLTPTPFSWRLNEFLWTDPSYQPEIESAIKEYFMLNSNPDTLPTTWWLAHKAVLWGHLIKFAADHNKKNGNEFPPLQKTHKNYIKLMPIHMMPQSLAISPKSVISWIHSFHIRQRSHWTVAGLKLIFFL